MKEWQFNVLFFVGVGGAVLLLVGPAPWVNHNPTAATGVGAILTYVLTQRKYITKSGDKKSEEEKEAKDKEAKDKEEKDKEEKDNGPPSDKEDEAV